MTNSIVQVNVSVQVAPTPATLQQSGALVSHGGTINSPGSVILLTQLSDLTPYINPPAALTSLVYSGGTVTATTSSPHNLPIGQTIYLVIAGAVPTGYDGTFACTITGASSFTYTLTANPGSETTAGTWQVGNAITLTQMATTYFAQGNAVAVSVLELGATDVTHAITSLSAYLTANPNTNYVPGATGYFYSYLLPRTFDATSGLLSLLASYESNSARTYFFITTTLSTYSSYTNLMKCAVTLIESPAMGVYSANVLTGLSWTGGLATATTTSAHGILPGQWFQIAGCTPSGYNGWWLAAAGTTGSTLIWAIASNPGSETVLGTVVANAVANAGVSSTEFSHASDFYASLAYNPSTTNRVSPFAFKYLYGVTPFPVRNMNTVLATLKASAVNYVGTGAEGGISETTLFWGTTQDGKMFNYWYSIDWVQINLDLATANAVINGSNNPINPLYYNQPGVDVLQAVAASVMTHGITFGLVQGTVTQTALDGPVLDANLNNGDYVDQTVVNAVPFITYSLENPSDYAIGKYAGLAVVYMPQQGFVNIIYNVVVTELIGQ